jgi:hypothetical protein
MLGFSVACAYYGSILLSDATAIKQKAILAWITPMYVQYTI